MLIALEGIDGSGKRTQTERLHSKLGAAGFRVAVLSFPRYGETLFSQLVADYLNGKLGDLGAVHPRLAALLFAGDRFESRDRILELSRSNDVVILDRYVGSNLAYHAAKMEGEERRLFIAWLARMEYEVFGLPRPNLTLYLDLPAQMVSQMIRRKGQRTYTTDVADLHEKDTGYLARCRSVYQDLVEMNVDSPWVSIPCASVTGVLLDPGEISEAIWRVVQQAQATLGSRNQSR